MYNILEEIAQNIKRPLIQYTDQQKYDEKSKTFYLVKEKTILLDPKTIKVIEKSLDKAIVQMAKEVNKNIDEIHKQAVKKAIGSNTEPPQMNDLRYSEYLIKAGTI